MGVRNTTNDGKVALFDSTSGYAFGPVFESEIEADDFVEYALENHGVEDVRKLTVSELGKIHQAFVDSQEADGDE